MSWKVSRSSNFSTNSQLSTCVNVMCDAFLKVRCDTVNVKFVPHTQIRMTDQGGGTKTEKKPLCKSSIIGRRKYEQSTSCLWAGWGVRWSVITLSGCDRIIHTEIKSSVFMLPSQRGPAWLLHYQPGNRLVTWPGLSSAWPLMMSDDVNKMIIG